MKLRVGFVSNSSSEAFICETKKTLDEVEAELRALLDLYGRMYNTPYDFDSVFGTIKMADESDVEYLREYLGYYTKSPPLFSGLADRGDYNPKLDGKVIIYSASDNTIPYELFDIMCGAYKATRIHLG
jgi:hypothetical protein